MGQQPTVSIRESMMGYEVAVNGVTMAGPYDRRRKAEQAAKRLRREWQNNSSSAGFLDNAW